MAPPQPLSLSVVSMAPPLVELCTVDKEPMSTAVPTSDLHKGIAYIRHVESSPALEVTVVVKRTRCLPGDKDSVEAREATLRSIVRHDSELLHPNISTQMGVYVVDGLPATVREFYHSNLLQYTKSRPDVNKISLILQGCEGIKYLHALNIYHGNVTPGNMLVTAEGTIKVTDALLSFHLKTITGLDPRDWRYRAPEEILNDAPPSAPGDIFALGTTIQEVVAGLPIKGGYIKELRRLESQAPRTSKKPDEISAELWHLIKWCREDASTARPDINAVISHLSPLS